MRQQIFEDALKQIVAVSREDALNPRSLLGEIEKIAATALKRDGDPNDKRTPVYNPLKDDRNGQ